MLANAAVQARPGIFAGRPAALTDTPPMVVPSAFAVAPAAPWARSHLSFRGTRLFTGLMLGWAGLILFAFGMFAVPAANDLGRADVDPGLMAMLGSVAPFLWALGILHLIAAVGVTREWRTWGFRLSMWMLALGVFAVSAGLVFAVAGRDPFALTDPGASSPNGTALLVWTLGMYGIVGWGLRRILAARGLA
jgi:hypothetical protein